MPSFWLGLLLLIFFAVEMRNLGLPYFPAGGMYDLTVGPTMPQVLWHLVLPSITLATVITAGYIRYVRASMLEVIHQDYIRTARAKGLSERVTLRTPRLQERGDPAGDADRAGPAALPLRRDRRRVDLRLAGDGPALLGARREDRHPGA